MRTLVIVLAFLGAWFLISLIMLAVWAFLRRHEDGVGR